MLQEGYLLWYAMLACAETRSFGERAGDCGKDVSAIEGLCFISCSGATGMASHVNFRALVLT